MHSGSQFGSIILAGLAVFAVTLFPASLHQAPFNTVYGPTTDLRSSVNVQQALPLMLSLSIDARLAAPLAAAHAACALRDLPTADRPTHSTHGLVLRC